MSNTTQNQYVPDYVVPPGEILLEAIEERGMTQTELADRTGRKKKTINEIVKGIAPITPETALQFERALGVPADFWSNLEKNYRTGLARLAEKERLKEHVDWLGIFPIKAMVNKGWLEAEKDKVLQVQGVLNYFGVASPEQWEEMWMGESVAFRKSPTFESNPGALAAWLRQGELEAQNISCDPYDKSGFRAALHEIRSLTTTDPEVFQPELIGLCASSGVAVTFVPELPKTCISGSTRWLSPRKALIQLSLRHKSNDHLWFTFFHEAAHILLHGKKELFIDNPKNKGDKEDQANEFAAHFLVPQAKYESFLTKTNPRSKASICKFAEEIGIAPGIVVGRLQHDEIIPPSHCNGLKVRFEWKDC